MSDLSFRRVTEAVLTPNRRYRGLSADERRGERRSRLLEAAADLFGTDGYAATSIERLCARAGVTTRHFYEEFKGREDVLSALCEEIDRRTFTAVQSAVERAPGDAEARTRAVVATFVAQLLADPSRARIVLVESPASGPASENWRRTHRRYADFIRSQCELLAGKGLLPSRDFTLAATALVGAMNELLVAHCTGNSAASIGELTDELVRIFLVVEGGRRAQ
jgi:AcrR family transcriptional regulator